MHNSELQTTLHFNCYSNSKQLSICEIHATSANQRTFKESPGPHLRCVIRPIWLHRKIFVSGRNRSPTREARNASNKQQSREKPSKRTGHLKEGGRWNMFLNTAHQTLCYVLYDATLETLLHPTKRRFLHKT